jgi:hypothetical protein
MGRSRRLGLGDGGLIMAAALLSIIPLIGPQVLPLLDLPGHMGSYHIALEIARSSVLQSYYSYHWHLIGNLGVDVLVNLLGRVFGVEASTKVVVMFIPLLTVAGFLWSAREAHGRIPATAAIALPLVYCYPFHYGFVNYCLAMAFTSLAFALWLRLGRQGRWQLRAALFFVIAPVIWLAHAIGWVLLGALCGASELRLRRDRGANWSQAIGMTVMACLPLAWPILLQLLGSTNGPTSISGLLDIRALGKWVVAIDRDRWIAFDIASALFMLAALGMAAGRMFGLRFNPVLLWPALALGALYVIMPQAINGSSFVGARIIPYAVAYALLAIDPSHVEPKRRQLIAAAALLFFGIRLVATTISFALYDHSYRQDLAALRYVRPGSAVLVLARQSCAASFSGWKNARIQHLGGMALVRQNAFVNDQWTTDGLQLVGVRYTQAGLFLSEPSEDVSLERCQKGGSRYLPDALAALPRPAFQYVWLLDIPADARPSLPWLKLLHSTPETALYAVLH